MFTTQMTDDQLDDAIHKHSILVAVGGDPEFLAACLDEKERRERRKRIRD